MIIVYNEIEDDILSLSTSFSFEDGSDKVDVKSFDGELFKVEDNAYYLKGSADVVYTSECDRCGNPAIIDMSVDISINIEPGTLLSEQNEHEMNDDDGEIFFSDADSLDLHELLRQEIILQFPTKKICGPDCEGFEEYNKDSNVVDKATPLKSLAALEILRKDALKEK